MKTMRCAAVAGLAGLLAAAGCADRPGAPGGAGAGAMGGSVDYDRIAEAYVRLVLALGRHDADYVDAYYGPPEWRKEAEAATVPLVDLRVRAGALLNDLAQGPPAGGDGMTRLRHSYLSRQLRAVATRIDMLGGARLSFDDETRALYDAVAPARTEAEFQAVVDRVQALLPGAGPVHRRLEEFHQQFMIPADRLDTVIRKAIAACRERTLRYLDLPEGESFTIAYVKDKPWGAYNWYKGNALSLIEVNTSLPVKLEQALGLACHEGYPGHHVYNVLLEHHLVRGRGWVEFTVYPLFSPQSFIAEGSANYGVDLAFPDAERLSYERDVLFPLAGLDPARAATYFEIRRLMKELDFVTNEAARGYLSGRLDKDAAAAFLMKFGLRSEARAHQSVDFMDRYRTYVINYNLGEELVRRHVEAKAGPGATAEQRWRVFGEILSTPRLPGDLQ